MNALFDGQNNVLVEHSAESIIPQSPSELLSLHHEILLHEEFENIISLLGGSMHSQMVRITKEDDHV